MLTAHLYHCKLSTKTAEGVTVNIHGMCEQAERIATKALYDAFVACQQAKAARLVGCWVGPVSIDSLTYHGTIEVPD